VLLVLGARAVMRTRHLLSDVGLAAGRGAAATLRAWAALTLAPIAIAGLYLLIVKHSPTLREIALRWARSDLSAVGAGAAVWVILLAVVAAPLCEELIFRGMIFRGLRKGYGRWLSILAGAFLFAVVHPPISFVPVFALGIFAALAFEYSDAVWSGMLVHASYNAAVLLMQPILQ